MRIYIHRHAITELQRHIERSLWHKSQVMARITEEFTITESGLYNILDETKLPAALPSSILHQLHNLLRSCTPSHPARRIAFLRATPFGQQHGGFHTHSFTTTQTTLLPLNRLWLGSSLAGFLSCDIAIARKHQGSLAR